MSCDTGDEAVAVKVALCPSMIEPGSTDRVTVGVGPGVGVTVGVGVAVGVGVGVGVGAAFATMTWRARFSLTCPAVSPTTNTRSEEHMSELQSHSFISYAVFCLKK